MNNPLLGAAVFISLAKNYNGQMRKLLEKNGVIVPTNLSAEEFSKYMVATAKASLAYRKDLTTFLSDPKVLSVITKELSGSKDSKFSGFTDDKHFFNFTEEANYFRMDGYMNAVGTPAGSPFANLGLDNTSTTTTASTEPAPTATSSTPPAAIGEAPKGFWNNAFTLLNTGVNALLTLDTNKTNRAIADAGGAINQGGQTPVVIQGPEQPKSNTGTYVLVGVVGVGILVAAGFYFKKLKKQ